jgi:MFS family permease
LAAVHPTGRRSVGAAVPPQAGRLPPGAMRRAVRFSFAQAMTGAIYMASTGGMFLIGYALQLGATDALIGLMSAIPMLCIGVQLAAAAWIERGVSRRRLTFVAALMNVACWAFVILIPWAAGRLAPPARVSLLIAVISLVTLFGFVSGNARGSWVGDLIPARFRGTFFGRMTLYGGLVAAAFAIVEGGLLDVLKRHGLAAFGALFGFGMLFGLANALLFLPQAEVPLARHAAAGNLLRMVRETLENRALMAVGLFNVVWSMQTVAGPFYATYMLRDLGMPFMGVGIVNAFFMVAFLLSGPFWGRVVNRWGCRPVLVLCAGVFAPLQFSWLWVDTAARAYAVIAPVNLLAGAAVGGVNVALNTLLYKVTPAAGRSVQFAVYSILVVALAAPFPAIGGRLPAWLQSLGLPDNLRCTFYLAGLLILASAFAARRIAEPNAGLARRLARSLGSQWLAPVRRWIPWDSTCQ